MLTPQDVVHVRRCSRLDGARVGTFSFWVTVVPKGFLKKNSYSRRVNVTQPRPNQRGHPRVKSESVLHQRGPLSKIVPEH